MKPIKYVCLAVIICTGCMARPLWADQFPAARIEIGPIGGYAPSTGRPGIQSALFGGGYMAVRVWNPIWIVTEAGMVPTTSSYDQTFTINLFYARWALKIEGPDRRRVRPFFFIGSSLIEFDPAGRVDAEDALWRWSADGGIGLKYPLHNRLSFQLAGRISLISTRVEQFPILSSSKTSKIALYSFISSGLIVHF